MLLCLWKRVSLWYNKNRCMKPEKKQSKSSSFFQKVLEDKKAIRKCIQEGGDLKKIAKERDIKFSTPV